MLVYIFIFIFIILFRLVLQKKYFVSTTSRIKNKSGKTYNVFFLFSFIILFFFTGFRGETVGIDTTTYLDWYKEFNTLGWKRTFEVKKDIEPGYLYINYLVSLFSRSPHYLILTVSFLILCLHLNFLKKASSNFFISLVLYLSFNHFFTSMSSWRQFIAMGIVFFVYPLLLERKFFFAVLVMSVAFFFHYSTLIFDLAVVTAYIFSKNKRWLPFFLIASVIAPSVLSKVFYLLIGAIPKYAFYANSQASGSVGKLRFVYIFIEAVLILYVIGCKKLKSRKINMMAVMLSFSIMLGLLGASVPLVFRLGYYFEYFLLLLIPEIMVARNKNSSGIQAYIVCFGFLFYFYLMVVNSAGMIPWYMYSEN